MSNKIILVGGYAGNGKSYFGHLLSHVYNAVYLDKDTISRGFTEALLESYGNSPHDRESEIYLAKVRDIEYSEMMKVALENVSLGKNVICSAPFIKEIRDTVWLEEFEEAVSMMDADIHVLWVHCDAETAKERMVKRGAGRDKWKLENWNEYISKTPHEVPESLFPLYVIDNKSTPVEPLQAQVRRFVSKALE